MTKVKNLSEKQKDVELPVMAKADARKKTDELKKLFQTAEKSLVRAATIYDELIRGRAWKALKYETMTEWREKEIGYADHFNWRNAMKLLDAGVAPEQVEKMQLTNINKMTRSLPESKWKDPKLLKAAEGPVAQFEKCVAHEEGRTKSEEILRRGFAGPKSLIDKYDLALRVAEFVEGCSIMESRIEAIVSNYLMSDSDEPGKSKNMIYDERFSSSAVANLD